jgi:hypothetical protein
MHESERGKKMRNLEWFLWHRGNNKPEMDKCYLLRHIMMHVVVLDFNHEIYGRRHFYCPDRKCIRLTQQGKPNYVHCECFTIYLKCFKRYEICPKPKFAWLNFRLRH